MPDVFAAAAILAIAVIAFVASVGVGILVGRRLDRLVESRAPESERDAAGDAAASSGKPEALGQEVGVDGR